MNRSCLFILAVMIYSSLEAAKIINLDKDFVHKGEGNVSLFPLSSDHSEKLTIISTSHNAIIITQNSTWDLSDIGYACIEFAGNARLVCEPGSRLHATGGVLRFIDEARFVVGKG